LEKIGLLVLLPWASITFYQRPPAQYRANLAKHLGQSGYIRIKKLLEPPVKLPTPPGKSTCRLLAWPSRTFCCIHRGIFRYFVLARATSPPGRDLPLRYPNCSRPYSRCPSISWVFWGGNYAVVGTAGTASPTPPKKRAAPPGAARLYFPNRPGFGTEGTCLLT
jgi:hypothetical protein